jgi:RNA polymerase sigma-70 factor (ECF subfamily)
MIRSPHDLDLAGRCASGDRAAQRQLFRDQKRRVHATLYRILGSNRDMEDLVQDAFLEIFRSLDRFRGEAKLATWVDRITARVAYHYLSRKRSGHVHLEAVPEIETGDPSAERRAIARDAARRIYEVLDRLDPKYRIAFALHVIDGRPLREVADITEASLVATKSRVWRARREIFKRAKRDPALAAYLAASEREEVGP